MLYLFITIFVVGVVVYFLNRPEVPIVGWAKWLINALAVVGLVLYAANVLFGYHFPGLR